MENVKIFLQWHNSQQTKTIYQNTICGIYELTSFAHYNIHTHGTEDIFTGQTSAYIFTNTHSNERADKHATYRYVHINTGIIVALTSGTK